ncbi:MAG: SDR family oxidoreductase [Saprospiraceae bacterium]|nr:SDR family oxidoreductase [Saprospiraceae bacterium]
MKPLIIGATGNIGKRLVNDLLAMEIRPTVGVRDPEKARGIFYDRVDYRYFDFEDKESISRVPRGIDRIFFIAPHDDPLPSVEFLLEAAGREGVNRMVFSSGRTTGDIEGKPLYRIEQSLRASDLKWTILRPGWFMQNFTGWIGETISEEDRFYLPAGDAKTAFIDVRDIGMVAARCLVEEEHEGKTYGLTSEEAYDHHQVAEMIGHAVGREIEYVPMEPEAYIEKKVDEGWSRKQAEHTAELYKYVRQGKEEEVSPHVRQVLGRPPISLENFIRDYRELFLEL